MAKRKYVIEGLKCCIKEPADCYNCPFDGLNCNPNLKKAALKLIKKQKKVVRCKECKFNGVSGVCVLTDYLEDHGGHMTAEYDNWFCADGERMESYG